MATGKKFYRWLFYVLGMATLALGIVLSTKSRLGMSPILSAVYCLSEIYGLNFSTLTLIYYILLVAAQFLLRGRNYHLSDLLQVPVCIVFTRLMDIFSRILPLEPVFLWQKLLIAAASVLATGAGMTLALDMQLVPNPGDGIVQAISDRSGLSLGTSKNLFDGGSVLLAIVLSLILSGRIIGLGIGTVINVVCIGRVVALCTWLFKGKIMHLAFGDAKKEDAL
ncbi:MAG: DUF6198 family protein [Butyricicoccus sp.]|nr:DUF6198 family protein [Butyricicoccus sp.]